MRKERNLTYVLVSHDLAVISNMCDRLAVMNHGTIVEELTADQLQSATPKHAYTKQLLVASKGYDRSTIDQFVEFGAEG